MIIEKRRRIRKSKAYEIDWIPERSFVEIENWGEIRLPETTPKSVLFCLALVTAVSGFVMGSLLI